MADYIRRDIVLQIINTVNDTGGFAGYADYCVLFDEIDTMPAADVQPVKRGEWVQIGKQSAKCTECGGVLKSNGIDETGKAYIFNAVYHYCPFCGADMRKHVPIKE